MKKSVIVVVMIALVPSFARAERPRLDEREAPRATDLLQAQRLADQAKKRLEMPSHHGGGWKHGGSAWGDDEPSHGREPRDVIINLDSPRRRPRPER
jgi:hypothetical protein